MKHGPPSLARLVAWSALLLGLSVGGTACGDRPQPPAPPASELPDADRSTVEVNPARGLRANGQEAADIRVTVRKADGSALAGQTVSVVASGEGNTLTQAAGPTDAEGVAVAKLVSTVAGIKTVTASVDSQGGPVTLSARPTVEFVAVAAPHLAFTAAPTSGTAGQALGAFDVTIQDEQGKTVTGASQTVTVALGAGSPAATLKGTLSVAAVNGVARFSTLMLEKAAAGYVLTASAPGLASATSASFEVLPAAASQFTLVPPASAVTAGTRADLELSVADGFGNAATQYTGTVRVTTDDPQAVLPANHTFTAADKGRHTFGVTLKLAGTRQVTVTDTANAALTAKVAFSVLPAGAAQLVFTQQPMNTGAGQAFEVRVALLDSYGNRPALALPQVTLRLNKGTLAGNTTMTPVDGVASFPGLSIARADTGYVLTASAPGLPDVTSNSFEVTPSALARLVLSTATTTTTAGTAVRFTLKALDALDNPATGYRGTVRFTSSDTQATLPASHTFVASDQGLYSFDATFKLAGRQSISATDTVNAALTASAEVTVSAAAATRLAFIQQPGTTSAGQAFEARVELRDAYGNRPPVSAPQVTLALNKGTLTGSATATPVDGVAAFPGLSIAQADTGYVLTASAPGLTPATSSPFDITANAVSRFVLTAASSTATAGTAVRFTLKALDALDNPATGYRGTVRFASSDTQATLPAEHTFTAAEQGVYSFDATLRLAGRQTVSATDTTTMSLTASAEVTVSAAAATKLLFSQQPATTGAGQAFEVRVELRDAYGNRPPVSAPQVTLALNKGTLTGTKTVAPVDGVATFPGLSIAQADTGYVLTASATGLTPATSNPFDITAAAVSKLVLTGSATATAGSALTVTVTAQDAAGNRVTGYTGTVSFTLSDAQGSKPADYLFTAGDAGQKAFQVTFKTAGDQTVSVTDGTLNASLPVRVSAAAVAKLEFRAQPTNASVRQTLAAVRVALVDAYGNVANVSTPQVELFLVGGNNAATLSGTTKVSPSAGIATFSTLSVDQQGTDFWLSAMAGSLNSVESARFTIVDNVAPATVTLTAPSKTSTQVDLAWRAVGDDGTLGNATSQELRYATSPLNADNFGSGTAVTLGAPLPSGSAEAVRIAGLTSGTRYYFALKVTDDVGNSSLSYLDVTLSTNVCEGVVCQPDPAVCAADGVSRTTYTATCVDVNGTATCQQSGTTAACTGANAVCFNAACDSAARPVNDQVGFTEVMHTPSGTTTEYVELTNHTDTLLNLNGLTVSYENSAEVVRSFLVGTGSTPVVVGRKGRIVLAANKDTATNGGVAASFQYPASIVLDGSGSLSLSNGGTPVALFQYSANFPQSTGKAMNLSSLIVGTRSAVQPWYWCDSTAALPGGDYGTPQAANSSCGIPASPTVSTCFIQGPKTLPSTPAGTATTITGRFRAPGATDRNTAGNDSYPHVVAELGYGPSTSNATTWTWAPSPFNSEYTASVSQEDEVAGTLNITTPGDYKYGFRFAFRDPTTNTLSAYTYCGQSDIADPANGIFGTVTVTGSTTPTTDHVVISEFAHSGTGGANDEFIELYNPTNAEVDIAGWKLQYKSQAGTGYTNSYTLPAGAKIAAHGYYLVTGSTYAGSVVGDASFGTSIQLSGTAGHVRLGKTGIGTAIGDALTVDRVGYGPPPNPPTYGDAEGTNPVNPAPVANSAGSMERKAVASSTAATMEGGADALRGNGYDSDNNGNDFVLRTARNPQNKASALEVP